MGLIIPAIIAVIIFASVFLLITVFSGNIEKSIDPIFGKYLKSLEKEFVVLNITLTPRSFMMYQIGASILLFVVGLLVGEDVVSKIFVAIVLAALAFFGGRIYLSNLKSKRKQRFEEQFVDAIALIANAVRSGLSLMQALELTVSEMTDPISYEVNLVIQSTRLGVSLDIAMVEWINRMDSKDLDIFVTAVLIQNQTGGNLSDILETLGTTIRDRFKIQRQIKALTAQGTASAYVLTSLPILLGVALYFIQPETMSLMFTTTYGVLLSMSSLGMIGIGGLIVKKIVNIDV